MQICNVPSLLCTLLFLFSSSILFLTPPTLQFSDHPHARHGNASDEEALLAFLSAITYDPWHSLTTTWKRNVSFCDWTGVICSRRRQRVVSLNVSSMELQGTISPLLGNLSFLRILDLGINSFDGHIPYQLGNLFRLNTLYLDQNPLQGSIPPTLARCRSLRVIFMGYNNLTGNIPYELICDLPRLEFLALHFNNLAGRIPTCFPSSFSNLTNLRVLDIAHNQLSGHIPVELCRKSMRLTVLALGRNKLSGSIPASLSNCTNLELLDLDRNQLRGIMPLELGKLTQLQVLYLHVNQLNGSIPASLSNCTNLYSLDLGRNPLRGIVPLELGKLTQLQTLWLGGNQLSGTIPASLSNCTNLNLLDLDSNQLRGIVPLDLGKLTQLQEFALGVNQLSGSIPAFLSNCTNLQKLDLGYNQLRGIVPLELGKLTQLQVLYLGGNQLASSSTTDLPILTALTNCSVLLHLDLSRNHLTGRLPSSVGHLSMKFEMLDLEGNRLVGEIPPQIGNLTNLTSIYLAANSFTGEIPAALKNLQYLQRLYMGSNNLQGNIPMEIGQLKNLGLLDLGNNNLIGRIPDSIANHQQLRYLYLSMNRLSGKIPENLGKCVNLLLVDLSYNTLSGEIPPTVASLANLAFYFNLSNNLLEGHLPLELSKMTMLQAIDISANRLTGYIPSGLGSCKELEYLNLSCNALEGLIPNSLGELLSLQGIDFSSNNLSGGIPTSLANLKMLSQLNFSFNNLSGQVPKGGVFKNLNATSFMGNSGLCGPWVNLSLCSTHKHKSVSHLRKVVIPIVAIVITIVLCLVIGILCRLNHKKNIPMNVGASLNVGHRRISYGELITATNGFSDANLLGVGTFGKVYKGVLNDGTLVAIKLLNLEKEGAHKSFKKECKVLSRVRHRNLIRVITSYSDLQMKALIFPFMPNGSLEKWLYPNGEVESGLTLIQRLNIAIDIAQGMVYLHHHCFMQVIHCDLKPNNVLLGEDMTAYVIDFGIATIYFANNEDSTFISTLALKGSVGYIPPEYGLGGHVTTKGDVYSYGIVLLEMLTGKKPTDNMFVEGMNLQKWVGSNFPNQLGEVVDKSLLRGASTSTQADKDLSCLNQSLSMGLLCTRDSPEGRPTMMDIVGTLQSIRDTFQGIGGVPQSQSNLTCLFGVASTTHNNTTEGQSSSTF